MIWYDSANISKDVWTCLKMIQFVYYWYEMIQLDCMTKYSKNWANRRKTSWRQSYSLDRQQSVARDQRELCSYLKYSHLTKDSVLTGANCKEIFDLSENGTYSRVMYLLICSNIIDETTQPFPLYYWLLL